MSDRIEIDLNGDLILLVGEESGQIRMRVSSSVLSATSPMFQNMLSGRFKEGNSLDSEDPEEIPLPEDYAVTVEVFCNIAHQNGSKVPSQLSPHELLLFAEFVDKHQCQSSFDFHLRAWIEAALAGAPTATDLQFILEACFLLDRPQAFWKVSGRLATMIDPTWQYDMDSPMPREAMSRLRYLISGDVAYVP